MNATVIAPPTLHRLIEGAYDEIYNRVRTGLKAAGLEILAEINLTEFLAQGLQSYVRPYNILVVCNAELAHRALTIAPGVGVMLPCHVAVLQTHDELVEVKSADPLLAWDTASHAYLKPVAEEFGKRLERVVTAL
ncbi:MAG: DUF302 domain-containing protein [Anaerolineae bacterium]